MTEGTQPTEESSSHTPSTGSSRFPQELYDIIIALASTECLSPCSLVCRSWLYTASSRLLADFSWPTKSLAKEKKHQEDGFFRYFMKALTESSRLQGSIRSLRLGPAPGTEIGHTIGSIEISLLVDIISLCPRLDNLTLSRCRPHLTSVALERRQCGRIGTLAFSGCSMASPADAEGVLHTLSLFSRVDRLRLSFYGARVSMRPTNLLSTSLEIGRIETFETLAGFDPGAWELLRHICASPSVRASVRGFATYDEFCPEVWDCLQQLSGVEELTYCVDRFVTPAFSIIPSIRRLKMFVVNPGALRLLWSSTIRDLMLTPDQLQHVTIAIFYPVLLRRPLREEDALEKLRALLEDEDWHPLEQFLEQRTPLKSFEFEVLCIYKDHAHVAYREPWSDVDPGHAEEMFRGVMDRKLSKGAAARSIITPIVREILISILDSIKSKYLETGKDLRCYGILLYPYLVERLGPAAERLEDVACRVRRTILPSFNLLPSLRRVTMYTSRDKDYHFEWPRAMRDLGLALGKLHRVTICLKYCYTATSAIQEAEVLEGLKKKLLEADWAPLEEFIETRPSVEAVELRILMWCSYARQTSHDKFESPKDVDFGSVEGAVREVALYRLSDYAAKRVFFETRCCVGSVSYLIIGMDSSYNLWLRRVFGRRFWPHLAGPVIY